MLVRQAMHVTGCSSDMCFMYPPEGLYHINMNH